MRIQKLNILNKIAPKKKGGWGWGAALVMFSGNTNKYHAYDCYSEGVEAQTRSVASCKPIFQLDAPAHEDAPPC